MIADNSGMARLRTGPTPCVRTSETDSSVCPQVGVIRARWTGPDELFAGATTARGSSAGGRTPLAHDGAVTLRRTGGVIEADVRTDIRLSELTIRSGDELMVPRRSWLDRNVAATVSGGVAIFGILVAIALR